MRKPPGSRSDYMHFQQHSTRWNDNDTYGHLNNVVHYQLFDTTVNEWLIRRGILDPRHSPIIGLVAETGCRYFSEMSFPQRITCGLRVATLGNSSVRYEMGLFPEESEIATAEGFLIHVYVDARTRRPSTLPAATRTALSALVRGDGAS